MAELSRRAFVRAAGGAVVGAAVGDQVMGADAADGAAGGSGGVGRRRPNVVLIFLDDLGAVDLGCYGASDLVTPNLDRLAGSGVRFTQFYSAAPICSASRGGSLTGRVPQRNGLEGNAASQPGGVAGLRADVPTLATILKDAGYVTGHVGKWHLGYRPEMLPLARGFDSSFGHMGGCIDNYSHFFFWEGPNRHDLWRNGVEEHREGEYFGDLMVGECKKFIGENRGRPFFLYWAINQPHYPLQGRGKWREKYKGVASPRNMYAASVSTADEMIGEVLAYLDEVGVRGETIVLFQSDHGHSTEVRTFGGGGSAGPYRGAKFSLFEGGIRMASMISYPGAPAGMVPAGAVRSQFVAGVDWVPTVMELAGIDAKVEGLDGRSMVGVIRSADAAGTHSVYHWRLGTQWAVREGDWKLVGNPVDSSRKAAIGAGDRLFLSDLSKDVSEMRNLAGEHPEVVKRLVGLHEGWVGGLKS